MLDEFLVLKLVEREVKAHLHVFLITSKVCDDTAVHFELHICTEILPSSVFVFIFELYALHISPGDDVRAKSVVEQCDDGCRNHVRTHNASETGASRYHGDDFGVFGKFRGEEDDGNEDKQLAEQIGVERDEVQVVVKQNFFHRGIVLQELVDVLIEVKHDSNADNQHNGEEICAEELSDDVTVES